MLQLFRPVPGKARVVHSLFGITMSQFFAEGEMVELTPELKELFDNWVDLTPNQKAAVLQMLKAMNHDNE